MIKQLAKTNHSNVYLVRHTALDTLRVAKVIRKADMDSDTILREARLIKNLKHSHIPVIYDIEEDDISICIIEEYISGKSLRSYINDTDNIKTSEICDIAVKLCDILEYLHNCDNEIIHLDIKPDNIIIDEHNNVKLIDFGSSIHKAGLTQAGMISPGYAAPEQYSGKELTYQTDIYSVGMVLKFMADSNSTVHNKLYPVINKCTRHNQYRRYKNVKALRWELEQTARSDITFFQKIKFINKNAINKTSSIALNNTYVSGSVLENYKINSIYGIKNYSYIIKVSGSRRGIGVTHTVLSMAHCLGDYGLKCLVIEGSGRTDILQTALADNSICSTSEGLLIGRGIWLMPSYGRDETQGVNYDIQDNFDIVIIDSGVNSLFKDCDNELKNIHMDSCNERVMIDSYGYEAIMNDNNSKIINICVVGGKYDVRSESSLIDETDKICHNSIIFVNLVNEVQFYGYSNTIADKKSCYRVPCIYEWYENNAAWTLIMKDFMQDNLTALWENIDAGQKKELYKILYEKIWVIMQKIKTNKRIKTYKGIEAEKKEQGITKSV
ncbi:MAG: serine/threonine-protein kinase [Lachnospira pectinoschiza]